ARTLYVAFVLATWMDGTVELEEGIMTSRTNGLTGADVPRNKKRTDKRPIDRRSFLQTGLAAGTGAAALGLLPSSAEAAGGLPAGDAALLRFPAALEILEADFWIQYNELGGVQDAEVPGGTGNPAYAAALANLDEDMAVYIHDNTDDEITHHQFLNAYLVSKGAAPANLDPFLNLMGSTATGVNADLIGR